MPSLLSKENWLKGVLGLGIVKDALIPILRRHYLKKAKECYTDDDHLNHLLDLGATKEVKQMKQREGKYIWNVNCSECRPLLKLIEMCHRQPARLMWMNNQMRDSCPKEYRLARIFMSAGNENTKNYSELDALAVLEILKNDISFRHSYNEILYLILFRNRLMHSSSNCINPDELEAAFSTMKKLLEEDKFKNLEECKAAVKELDKLQQVDVICEVDESNKIWKQAKSIQRQALGDLEQKKPIPEVMSILLTKMEVEYHKEKMQQLESELSESKEQIIYLQTQRENERSQLTYERRQREYEQSLREIEQHRAEMLECLLDETKYRHQIEMKESNKEKEGLEELIEDLTAHTPTFFGRVAKGTVTGTGVGVVGGPAGAAIGATAGGVVGGISYLWDKIRN